MKRRNIIIGVIIIILLVAAYQIFGPKSSNTNIYVSEAVKKQDINFTISANGYVNPENLYNVNPRISARIVEVNVKKGDTVTKDQQLAKLDDTDLQNAVKTAEYNFNAAVYTRDQLKNAPIVDDYSVKKAQQQINATWVQVQAARNNVNNAILKSPIEGKVLAVNIKQDEFASMTALQPAFMIGSAGALQAYLNVNELDINKVKPEQDVNLGIDAVGGTLTGKVISMDEQGTNTAGIIYYQIRTSVIDQTGLKPNMSVNGEVIIDSRKDVLTVPSGALITRSGKTYVELARTDKDNNIIPEEREVQVGINNNTLAEIISGLAEGDQVIINFNNAKPQTAGFSFGGAQ